MPPRRLPPGFELVTPPTTLPEGFEAVGPPTPTLATPPGSGQQPTEDVSLVPEMLRKGLLRPAYAAARGAATGLPGMFGDAIQLGHAAYSAPSRLMQTPHIGPDLDLDVPFSTANLNRRVDHLLHVDPGSSGPLEDIAGLMGQTASQGLWLSGLEKLGMPLALVRMLRTYMSAGLVPDVVTGAAMGIGGTQAESLAPNSPWAKPIGQLLGGVGVSAAHRLGSGLTQKLGNPTRLTQDVEEATTGVKEAQDAFQSTRSVTAQRLAQQQERQRLIERGETMRASGIQTHEVDPAMQALAQQQQRVAQAVTDAEKRAGFQTTAARQGAEQAHAAVSLAEQQQAQALAPVAPTLTQHVGTVPEKTAGALAKQTATAGVEQLRGAQLQAFRRLQTDIGPRLSREQLTHTAMTDFVPKQARLKKLNGDLFEVIEQAAGDNGPVLESLVKTTGRLHRQTGATGQPMPRGTGAMLETARPPGTVSPATRAAGEGVIAPKYPAGALSVDELQELGTQLLSEKFLPATDRAAVQQFLTALERGEPVAVPLRVARRMESALDEMQRGALPVGTQLQGRTRAMLTGIREDINTWLQTQPAGADDAALRTAKETWKEFLHVYNYSTIHHLLDQSAKGQPSRWLESLMGSSQKAAQELSVVKANANPATWKALQSSMLEHLFTQATQGTGTQSPQQILSVVRNLQKNGKLDILLDDPQQKARLLGLAQDVSASAKSPQVRLDQALANKTPQEVSAYVFAPGNVGRTEQYKAITDTAVYDQVVKGWVGRMLADIKDLTPEQVVAKLTPYTRRGAGEPSQLDHMLEQYPGVADTLTHLVDDHRRGGVRVAAARDRARLASEGATTTEQIGKNAVTMTEEAGERTLAQAQATLDQANARLTQQRAALETMQARGKEGVRITKEGIARQLAPFQENLDRAKEGLTLAKTRAGMQEGDVKLHGSAHLWGLAIGATPAAVGITMALQGVYHQNPLHMALGGAVAMSGWVFKKYAASQSGRTAIRQGYPQRYPVGRLVVQVLDGVTEPQE